MPKSKKPLSTRDVPARFLEASFLVGHVPQMALQSDPRVSYSLYVPPEPYKLLAASPDKDNATQLPLLVNIHGTRRNLSAIYGDLKTFADSIPCAVLQPLFPAGIEGPNDLDSYKRLASKSLNSNLRLLSILDEVGTRWPHIDTEKIFLMGFSGGGQFAQRFLYIHPDRLSAVSIGAPGKVTLLDEQQTWPKGIKDVQNVFSRSIDLGLITAVDIHMVVGSKDTGAHGGNDFKQWQEEMKKKTTKAKDAGSDQEAALTSNIEASEAGKGRLGTLLNVQRLWKDQGIEAHLDIVDGVGHSADGVRSRVLEFFRPLMQTTDKL
ncbi:poly hydrolase [Aureobasidium namibiae CBS 147.97]|uniref:Poly hydrolase n=1 Tax=Aureobasidium namibiae CBS 147.97 TaxID=1043004 RepID=A0A074WT78_9PEZI